MNIEKVIFTIDDNPHYKSFWFSISKHFKEKLNFNSKLFIIGDNPDISSYECEHGEVEFIKKIDGVPTIIQALIGKFYFTLTELETTWMVGDLDLYPLQNYHFKNRIKDISDDKYVHLNPYAYGKDWRNRLDGLAGYYHVAKGKIFKEELKFVNKSFEDVVMEIFNSKKWGIMFHNINSNPENRMASSDYGWFCSEEMYTGELLKNSNSLVELPPINGNYERIDRSNMIYDVNLIKSEFYIDFHSPRPYESHKNVIEHILSNVK